MANLNQSVLILFGISAALALLFPLWRDGVYKQLTVKPLMQSALSMILTLLPFGALFGLAAYLGMDVSMAPYFVGSFLLTWLVNRVGLSPQLRGCVLLIGAVLLSYFMSGETIAQLLGGTILGLLAAKLADNLMWSDTSSYDDVVAPVSWLAGLLWFSANQFPLGDWHANLLLGTISVCLLLKIFQRPFMTDDRWLLKRIVLSLTGGLAVLLVITKMMLAVQHSQMAILVGAAIFAAYLFQNVDADGENKVTASTGIQMLIVIGILTLVATRFWGIFGLILMVPAAILPVRGGFAQYAGLFFLSRVLLQCFVATYNSNITGINVTHAYTGAALYAGFIALAILFMLMRETSDRRVIGAVFIAVGAFMPVTATYYLHAEPTSSLLVAATVAGVIFAVLGPALHRNGVQGYGNLLLIPSTMAAAGITYGGIIEVGVNASNETRLIIVGSAVVLVAIATAITWFASKRNGGPKTAVAAE